MAENFDYIQIDEQETGENKLELGNIDFDGDGRLDLMHDTVISIRWKISKLNSKIDKHFIAEDWWMNDEKQSEGVEMEKSDIDLELERYVDGLNKAINDYSEKVNWERKQLWAFILKALNLPNTWLLAIPDTPNTLLADRSRKWSDVASLSWSNVGSLWDTISKMNAYHKRLSEI